MHTLSESHGVIWVLRAGNDAVVGLALPMKPFKIGVVVGKQTTLVGNGIRENFRITNALASTTRVLDRPYVVSEAAQFLDNRQGKILVCIQPGHE
jgi:hypothetical protein